MNRTIHSCQPVTYNKTKNKHGRAKYQLVILSKTEKSNGAGNTARTTLNLKTFHLDKSTSRLPKCVAALRAARQKSVFLLAKRDLVTGHSGQLGGRWWHARGRLWDYLLRQAIETGASIVPVLKQVGILFFWDKGNGLSGDGVTNASLNKHTGIIMVGLS